MYKESLSILKQSKCFTVRICLKMIIYKMYENVLCRNKFYFKASLDLDSGPEFDQSLGKFPIWTFSLF